MRPSSPANDTQPTEPAQAPRKRRAVASAAPDDATVDVTDVVDDRSQPDTPTRANSSPSPPPRRMVDYELFHRQVLTNYTLDRRVDNWANAFLVMVLVVLFVVTVAVFFHRSSEKAYAELEAYKAEGRNDKMIKRATAFVHASEKTVTDYCFFQHPSTRVWQIRGDCVPITLRLYDNFPPDFQEALLEKSRYLPEMIQALREFSALYESNRETVDVGAWLGEKHTAMMAALMGVPEAKILADIAEAKAALAKIEAEVDAAKREVKNMEELDLKAKEAGEAVDVAMDKFLGTTAYAFEEGLQRAEQLSRREPEVLSEEERQQAAQLAVLSLACDPAARAYFLKNVPDGVLPATDEECAEYFRTVRDGTEAQISQMQSL